MKECHPQVRRTIASEIGAIGLPVIAICSMNCGSLRAADVDKYMEEALAYPDLSSLAAVCRDREAVRGVRVLSASSWGFGSTDIIETKTGFLFIFRACSYDPKAYRGETTAVKLPLDTKDLAALLQAFTAHPKEDLLRDLPPRGRAIIDGGSWRMTTFIRDGSGYEIDIPYGQELGKANESLPAALVERLRELETHYLTPLKK